MARLLPHHTLARLLRSRDYIADCYGEPVSLDVAAKQACLSKYHFQRVFQSAFGETPHDFLTRRRMERARALLAAENSPVSEICFEVGYSSVGSFSARFHEIHGCTPSEYRARFRRAFAVPWPGIHYPVPNCFLLFYGVDPAGKTAIFEKQS
jgi:AraC-like DNA-binding protein